MVSSTSMKVVEKMERFQKAYSILEALTSEFQMFKSEETKEDWTAFMRNLYKYEYTMKVLYEIMEYFENYLLKKKKLDDKSEADVEDYEKTENNSPEFEETSSNHNKELSQSQVSFSMSNSTYLAFDPKDRKESETDSKSHKIIKRIQKQRFPKYEGIYLKYSIGYTFAPVSILACALNSPEFLTVHNENKSREIFNFKLQFNTKIKTSYHLKQEVDSVYK
jgi:hypothetical protein